MRKSSSFARGASKFRGVTKHKVGPCTRLAHPPSFPSSSLLPSTRLLQTPTKNTELTPGCVMPAVRLVWLSLCNRQQKVEAVTCPCFVVDPVSLRLQHLAGVVCTDGTCGPFITLYAVI